MNNNTELIKTLTEEANAYKNQAEAFGNEAGVRLEITELLRESKSQPQPPPAPCSTQPQEDEIDEKKSPSPPSSPEVEQLAAQAAGINNQACCENCSLNNVAPVAPPVETSHSLPLNVPITVKLQISGPKM